tara:strand:- start:3113 stop:3457 length:345 start_codon:yes stop_codon:yes gene_type:complete
MTIKLCLLKSGEDVISDMTEMVVQDQVVGYFLKYPCVAQLVGDEKAKGKSPFKLRLTPWMPMSKEKTISVVADWVISITEPIDELKETYERGIAGYEQREDSDSDDESSSDQSD